MVGYLLISSLSLIAACDRQDPSPPRPTPITPTPIDAAPALPDAPPMVADLQCYFNGAKEYIRIKTDVVAMTGTLERITAGPVPDRVIKYRVVTESPQSYQLVFESYGPGDYHRMRRGPTAPREKLTAGKSIVARVVVAGLHSRIEGVEVDLITGMQHRLPAGVMSYPCNMTANHYDDFE